MNEKFRVFGHSVFDMITAVTVFCSVAQIAIVLTAYFGIPEL